MWTQDVVWVVGGMDCVVGLLVGNLGKPDDIPGLVVVVVVMQQPGPY